MKMEMPLVSVVIVNFNGKKYLESCINSVLNCDYLNLEIIVVDNGSHDGSVELLEVISMSDSRIKFLKNEINMGPSVARNQGIREARGEYLAFLDNDTTVHPLWLGEALKIFNSDQLIGACQCKLLLLNSDTRLACDKFDYIGDYLSPYGFLVQKAEEGQVDSGQFDQISEIFAVKSAGMIVKAKVLEEVGLFDEDYFIYVEETDLCWRIWLSGYKVLFIPYSKVYHAFAVSSKLKSPFVKYLSKYHGTKNHIITLIKNIGSQDLIKILPIHLTLWFGIFTWHVLNRKINEARWIIGGIVWCLRNARSIWMKRQFVQHQLRRVPDEMIMPKIMKKRSIRYFYGKLTHPNSGWRA